MGTSVDMPLHEHGAMQAFMSFIGACEGAVFVDTDGTIRWMNERYASFLEIATEESVGRAVGEAISNTRLHEVLQTGEPILLDMQVIRNQPILVTRMPLRDAHGVIVGAIVAMLYDRLQRLQPMFLQILKSQAGPTEVHHEIAKRRARYTLANIAGSGDTIAEVKRQLLRCTPYNSTVLLPGETGAGKELAAHVIHSASPRSAGPFVAVNIAAPPDFRNRRGMGRKIYGR